SRRTLRHRQRVGGGSGAVRKGRADSGTAAVNQPSPQGVESATPAAGERNSGSTGYALGRGRGRPVVAGSAECGTGAPARRDSRGGAQRPGTGRCLAAA